MIYERRSLQFTEFVLVIENSKGSISLSWTGWTKEVTNNLHRFLSDRDVLVGTAEHGILPIREVMNA